LGRIELHILAGSSDPVSFSSADLQIPGKQDLPSTIDRTQGPALLIPLVEGDTLSTSTIAPELQNETVGAAIQQQITNRVDDLIDQLPNPENLTPTQRQG